MSKTIDSWFDLQDYGFNFLTGEADGTSLRVLFDVSQGGKEMLEEYFGFKGLTLHPNMNLWVGKDPAVGSLFLTHDIMLSLAAFCLLHSYPYVVIAKYQEKDGFSFGPFVAGYSQREWAELEGENWLSKWDYRVATKSGDARNGFRNIHQMSGRVE